MKTMAPPCSNPEALPCSKLGKLNRCQVRHIHESRDCENRRTHTAVLKWLCPILLQGQKHGAQATAVQRLQCCAFAAFEENLSDARQQRAEEFWCSLRVSRYAFASAY